MSAELTHQIFTIVIAVLIGAALAVIAYLVYRYLRKKSNPAYAEKLKRRAAYKEAIAPARENLKRSQKEYEARLQKRRDEIKAAENEHARKVKAQEKVLKNIEEQYNSHVTTFSGVKLYRDRLEFKGSSTRLASYLHAEVLNSDEFMNRQARKRASVAADAALEDITARQSRSIRVSSATTDAVQDAYEAYLVISGETNGKAVDIKVELDSRDIDDAQSFANTFNLAAADVDALRAQKAQQLEAAKAKLTQITNDKSAIEAAQAAYKNEKKIRGDIERAQQEFDQTEYEARKRRDGLK